MKIILILIFYLNSNQFIGPNTIRKSKVMALNSIKKQKNAKIINGLNNFSLHNEENENTNLRFGTQQHKRRRLTLNEKTNTSHSFSIFSSLQNNSISEDISEIDAKVTVPSWRVRCSFQLISKTDKFLINQKRQIRN